MQRERGRERKHPSAKCREGEGKIQNSMIWKCGDGVRADENITRFDLSRATSGGGRQK